MWSSPRLITALGWEYAILITACLVLTCIAFGCLMKPLESTQASNSKVYKRSFSFRKIWFLSFTERWTTGGRKTTHTEQRNYTRRAGRKRKTSKWPHCPVASGKRNFQWFSSSFFWIFSEHWKKRLVPMKCVKEDVANEWWCKCLYVCTVVNKFS